MNFFEAQDRSRRNTRRLIFLYIVATAIIVTLVTGIVAIVFGHLATESTLTALGTDWAEANVALLATTAASTTGFIGLASAYRVARLSGGGARVAAEMGATLVPGDVTDPLRKRLRNVVEEMAIASGVPVPEIYVMEEEQAINAFAAGYGPEDAAIAVTRGTLETLNRDELQGVIAHEFSHILNGDMRLNIRVIGILFGILAIATIGRMILRSARASSYHYSNRNSGGSHAIGLALGAGLYIVGYIGVFVARMIKAGISRQREYLADASAVQFTRQTEGIAGALKKIAGYQASSHIRSADAEEISHMLFARGQSGFANLFATHPPLTKRIQALDASFDPGELAPTAALSVAQAHNTLASGAHDAASGFATAPWSTDPRIQTRVEPGDWIEHSGGPGAEHVAFAGRLRRAIPELLATAVHSRDQAILLAAALVLDGDVLERRKQLALLDSRLGSLRAKRISELYEEAAALGPMYRLPLLELAFPALKDRPRQQLEFLVELVDELIELDGRIDLYEYSFARVLQGHLLDASIPQRRVVGSQHLDGNARYLAAARTLLSILAYRGHSSDASSQAAFTSGLAALPLSDAQRNAWAALEHHPGNWVDAADDALNMLNELTAKGKYDVLNALMAAARHDHGISIQEAEMLRAIAAVLNCPLSPLLEG